MIECFLYRNLISYHLHILLRLVEIAATEQRLSRNLATAISGIYIDTKPGSNQSELCLLDLHFHSSLLAYGVFLISAVVHETFFDRMSSSLYASNFPSKDDQMLSRFFEPQTVVSKTSLKTIAFK